MSDSTEREAGAVQRPVGIFGKYTIGKASGEALDPEACYFVLRLDTDPAAQEAARAYAVHCENRQLAHDLTCCLVELTAPCTCRGVDGDCRRHGPFSAVWRVGSPRALAGQPQSERAASTQAEEALRRLHDWGGFLGYSGGKWSGTIVCDVMDWFVGGMKGPLPPLPEWTRKPAAALQPEKTLGSDELGEARSQGYERGWNDRADFERVRSTPAEPLTPQKWRDICNAAGSETDALDEEVGASTQAEEARPVTDAMLRAFIEKVPGSWFKPEWHEAIREGLRAAMAEESKHG